MESTTIARVRAAVNPNIKKQCDSNHSRKGFTSNLMEMMSNIHEVLKNVKVRGHNERFYMYCVKQKQGNPKQLDEDLQKSCSKPLWYV